jgi:hypothetical protein
VAGHIPHGYATTTKRKARRSTARSYWARIACPARPATSACPGQASAATSTWSPRQHPHTAEATRWPSTRSSTSPADSGGHTHTGALPDEPRRGWRNLFVDEIHHATVADPATTWETADNYNASHPFNSIDQLSIAINPRRPRST